ncbi:hypothetical protein KIV56_13765 [Cryobacterium breve]|uniref:Uncharacterized protein n=1 Tax=Cryobacterium breve TaxID=1259258 RepID=A0ABY7NI36_9MICO|nr:hypothetical protein [Cryobacterium breve]WBM81642.1 hypothetical protein KIV56_13765 [Cryobacterium breve]
MPTKVEIDGGRAAPTASTGPSTAETTAAAPRPPTTQSRAMASERLRNWCRTRVNSAASISG